MTTIAMDVAMYFVCQADVDAGDAITNLKIQKLLYYAQGASLAIRGEALFEEDVLCWQHGPVVRSVYDQLKSFEANPIVGIEDACERADGLTDEQRELLSEVYDKFGQFSAWRLRDMTHEEDAWSKTPRNEVIDPALIESSFRENHLS